MVYFTVLKTCSSKNNHLKEQKARVGKYIVIHMPFSAQVSRIYKVWSIHTTQCYWERDRNEVMTHATVWMSLENMLSEGCQ